MKQACFGVAVVMTPVIVHLHFDHLLATSHVVLHYSHLLAPDHDFERFGEYFARALLPLSHLYQRPCLLDHAAAMNYRTIALLKQLQGCQAL